MRTTPTDNHPHCIILCTPLHRIHWAVHFAVPTNKKAWLHTTLSLAINAADYALKQADRADFFAKIPYHLVHF